MKKITAILLVVLLFAVILSPVDVKATEQKGGTYKMLVEGFDYGPGVTKLILSLDNEVDGSAVKAGDFSVVVTKQAFNWTTFQPGIEEETRIITDAYVSDENGNQTDGKSRFVTLSLAVSPIMGNPFYFSMDFATGAMGNLWASPYTHAINYTGTAIENFNINEEAAGKIMEIADSFDITGTFTASDGIKLTYATYEPTELNSKRPLLIWLHGAGEGNYKGAADPSVALLGNKVVALADKEIQGIMGGAYILTPQAPTMWMDNGAGYTTDGKSIYTIALMELIQHYIKSTPNVDTNRIYIGGCSNGGYMTMNMLLSYPDYFAAAYPICEAYSDKWITDSDIKTLKNIPIWFTQAKADNTVAYDKHAVPTYERLIAVGASNTWLSLFDTVVDTSGLFKDEQGNPYTYDGHWSWIYALNNESNTTINRETVSIFEWLAKQKLSDWVNSVIGEEVFYTVVKGDNLWKIGKKYGVDYREIASLNQIKNVNLIYIGQELRISVPIKQK